jgi:hypothetical protein
MVVKNQRRVMAFSSVSCISQAQGDEHVSSSMWAAVQGHWWTGKSYQGGQILMARHLYLFFKYHIFTQYILCSTTFMETYWSFFVVSTNTECMHWQIAWIVDSTSATSSTSIADILTKPLEQDTFARLRGELGVCYPFWSLTFVWLAL